MRKKVRKFMQWLPVAVAVAGLSSCKKDHDVVPANTVNNTSVSQNKSYEPANNAPDTIINLSTYRMTAAAAKTQIATVGSTIIYGIEGKNAIFFNAGMSVAAEGAPNAFHKNDAVALDYLSKAGSTGNWWSIVTNNGQSSGTPLIQPAAEPAPGYYISMTALSNKGYSTQSQWCYINASSVPYITLPASLESKVHLGDFAAVINKKTGALSYAIFADEGEAGKAGRASINAATKVGINSSPKTGGTTSADLVYIIFPNSGNGYGRSLYDIKSKGSYLLSQFGGGAFLLSQFGVTTTTPPVITATAPTVNITSPISNATFTSPASVTINANAADADGTVSKVEFYNGATLLGSDAASPYSFNWANVAAGNYTITAKATDNSGKATTSSAIAIVVKAVTTTPTTTPTTTTPVAPTVSIISPVNNTSFTSPASVTINAIAADADGTVSKVDFYNGTTLIGTDATSPYSFNWAGVGAGSYTITTKATDNSGAVTTSSAVSMVVNSPTPAPTASGFKVVGYLADWSGDVNQVQYDKLTNIMYSFINTTASGSLSLGISTSRLSSVVSLAHAKGVKVSIAVGGWNNGDDSNFESMAASATATNTFITNVVNFVTTYNLDGVDIDWEYPNSGASSTNYANMMKALGAALHSKGKILSAAAISDGSGGAGILTEVFGYIDLLNVMAYDGGTPHSPYSLATASITYWTGRGCPKSKIMLGVPFYGKNPETTYKDLVAQDPTAPNKDLSGTVNYNGIKTIQDKTRLAMQQAGGIMIWELSQDAAGTASLLTAINNVVKGLASNFRKVDEKESRMFYFENTLASDYSGASERNIPVVLTSPAMSNASGKRRNKMVVDNLV